MKNKIAIILSSVAIVVSIVAICFVIFKIKPINVNFFAGLVGVLSLLVVVITWFQLSKGLSEETRIKSMVKDQVELISAKNTLSLFEYIDKLQKADARILDITNRDSENHNNRFDFITQLHLSSVIRNQNSLIEFILKDENILSIVNSMTHTISLVDILSGKMTEDERQNILNSEIYPMVNKFKDKVSGIQLDIEYSDISKQSIRDIVDQLKDKLDDIGYKSSELIYVLNKMFKLDIKD